MEWRASGILLSVRKHGETSAIIETLTPEQGRWAGVVRGGAGRRMTPVLQPGNQLDLTWRARLEEQLGTFYPELETARAPRVFQDREGMALLTSFCALASAFLPEREPAQPVYDAARAFLDDLHDPETRLTHYAWWEVILLRELGFGLDLTRCAATGVSLDLCYVSPRSGRAVSRGAGEPYKDQLLTLPDFLRNTATATAADFAAALRLTGFFLERWAGAPIDMRSLPPARERLQEIFPEA